MQVFNHNPSIFPYLFLKQSPIKTPMYAELDKWSQPRSIVAAPVPSSPMAAGVNTTNTPKSSGQKRYRHRRIGSSDSNGHFGSSSARSSERRSVSETRQVKMVDMETQTETMDISTDCSPSSLCASREISMYLRNSPSFSTTTSSPTIKVAKKIPTRNYRNHDQGHCVTDAASPNDSEVTASNEILNEVNCCSKSDEHSSTDYMNSNEQLDIRDSSDDDNLERLGRRVNEFFTENRLSLHSDNGNGSTVIDGRLLFNVMSTRRSLCMTENDKVTVISRCMNSTNNNSNSNSIQPQALVYKRKDHNCNNDEGDIDADNDDDDDDNGNDYCDDSWTDEEGEDSDNNYTSLRRKR